MKKTLIKLVLFFVCAFTAASVSAESLKDQLQGNLYKLDNGELVAAELNPSIQYIAVYFSAHWCPPCRKISPVLVQYYNDILTAEQKQKVEFVFYSWDHSASDMKGYMSEYNMKWPAVTYNSELLAHYNEGRGIPCLMILDAETGEVISDSYVGDEYRGPIPVLQELNALLEK